MYDDRKPLENVVVNAEKERLTDELNIFHEVISNLREEIDNLHTLIANTNNRIEEVEAEVFPSKPGIKDSGGWSAW